MRDTGRPGGQWFSGATIAPTLDHTAHVPSRPTGRAFAMYLWFLHCPKWTMFVEVRHRDIDRVPIDWAPEAVWTSGFGPISFGYSREDYVVHEPGHVQRFPSGTLVIHTADPCAYWFEDERDAATRIAADHESQESDADIEIDLANAALMD